MQKFQKRRFSSKLMGLGLKRVSGYGRRPKPSRSKNPARRAPAARSAVFDKLFLGLIKIIEGDEVNFVPKM